MTSNMENNELVNETATKFAYEHSWVALNDEMITEKLHESEQDFAMGKSLSWEEVKRKAAALVAQAKAQTAFEQE
ncbi:hypothetical protein HB847_03860 [Listeria booriae]|uniref:Uncharacterized protein n=1 Tax=Listeria booriae TaxID=1552123 RepID=A0A7X0WQW4_9LIST|nr:hypothetical protein [Listeria booriae]MBC1358140.1 hypothetical protein [Listeria booriae]MBC1371494.1 hypothetical protein [Listeria booriae]